MRSSPSDRKHLFTPSENSTCLMQLDFTEGLIKVISMKMTTLRLHLYKSLYSAYMYMYHPVWSLSKEKYD